MVPTAVSGVLESGIKLFVGIALALFFLQTTGLPELGAAGAIVGVSVGSFFALLYILIYFFKVARRQSTWCGGPRLEHKRNLHDILVFAVPVVVGSRVSEFPRPCGLERDDVPAQDAAEKRRDHGDDDGRLARQRAEVFQACRGPRCSLAAVLPLLSGAIARKDHKGIRETSTLALRMTLMVAIPAARRLCVFSGPICDLLLYSQPEDAAGTAPLLMQSPAVTTASLLYTTNSMIRGGRQGACADPSTWRSRHGGAHRARLRVLRHSGDQRQRRRFRR